MPVWQTALDDWLCTHHGIATTNEMMALGISPRTVERMIARRQLVTVLPGVYRSAQWPETHESKLGAACARNPAAMIAFTAAAKMWGVRRVVDKRIHVLVPHGSSPELAGIVVHRCRRIDPVDIVQRPDGIRLTSPPRTLFDSADMLGLSAARSAMEQILHEKMCNFATIFDTYRRLAHPLRPGTRVMAEVLASRPEWRKALQSNLEQLVLEVIESERLPPPVSQCPIKLPDGNLIHLDFGWPAWKVGIEVDDPAWHTGFEERHRDTRRDRKATTIGWTVSRVTKIDIDGDLVDAVRDVAIILRRQGWAA